jgi:hypothetical protein
MDKGGDIWIKEEIYGGFVGKEAEYKHLVLLMEATNV